MRECVRICTRYIYIYIFTFPSSKKKSVYRYFSFRRVCTSASPAHRLFFFVYIRSSSVCVYIIYICIVRTFVFVYPFITRAVARLFCAIARKCSGQPRGACSKSFSPL